MFTTRDRLTAAIKADLFSSQDRKSGAKLRRPKAQRYPYEAELLRVVDGDTLLVLMDLGFEVLKRQRIRLAGVDALSAGSRKGRQASAFVSKRLDAADPIVSQTKRADLHGRYVAHVFYSTRSLDFFKTFTEGHHLNQQLLSERLAVPVK